MNIYFFLLFSVSSSIVLYMIEVNQAMESLETCITSTCPEPFAGVTGRLFLNAVTAAIATHCMILNESIWPKDSSQEVIRKGAGVAYDYIVVGAGTAGSLVASQLSLRYPSWSILLIEAGDDSGVDSEIPAFLFLNQNSSNDWYYKTQPDKKSCLGFKDERCIWSKGKGMGGSGSINAMIYIRGHPQDFDQWEQLDNEWGYNDLTKYFENQEKLTNISDSNVSGYNYVWYDILDKAWNELGYTAHHYNHQEALIGTKRAKILLNEGKRLNTAKMFLKYTKNLTVIKNTVVEKVIINPNQNRINGVTVRHKNGISMNIHAKKEIILSAGSIATPQILMQSGIGPKLHLEEIGIKCMHDLPVGHNLQDHIIFPIFLSTNLQDTLPSHIFNLLLLQYMISRSGPIANIGITDYMGFINTQSNTEIPDVQFHFTYFPKHDTFVLRQYLEGIGYKNEIIKVIENLNIHHDFLGIYPTLLHPKSAGKVLLSKNNLSMPIIEANYLDHPDDISSSLKAIDFIHDLQETKSFKELKIKILDVKIPNCKKFKFDSSSYWACYIRHMATTIYHPVGTAKMGPKEDVTTVVNRELLVNGITNLRVVDASIMPSIPGANTMAATLAIAQKAVDIISGKTFLKDEL